jgi:hypothetical protein
MKRNIQFKEKWLNKRCGSPYFKDLIKSDGDPIIQSILKDFNAYPLALSNPSFFGEYNFKIDGCNFTSKENKIYIFFYADIKKAYLSAILYLHKKGYINKENLFKVMDEMYSSMNEGLFYSNLPDDIYNMDKAHKDLYNIMIGRIVACSDKFDDVFFRKFNMLWDEDNRIYIHSLILYIVYLQMCCFADTIHKAGGDIATATTDGLVYYFPKDIQSYPLTSPIFQLDQYPLKEYYKIGSQQCLISEVKGIEYKGQCKYIEKYTLENKGKFNDLIEFVLGKNAWLAFLKKLSKCPSIDLQLLFIENTNKWIENFITETPNKGISRSFIDGENEKVYYLQKKPTMAKWMKFLNQYSITEIEFSKVYNADNAMLCRNVGRRDYINKEIIHFDKYLSLDNIKNIIDNTEFNRTHIQAPCRSGKTFQLLHYANQRVQTIIAVFTEASMVDMIEECKSRGYSYENKKLYHYFNKRFVLCYFSNLSKVQKYFNEWYLIIDEEHNFGFYKDNFDTILSWGGKKIFVSATPSYTMVYDKCFEFIKKDKANIDNLKIIKSNKIINLNSYTQNKYKYIYIDNKDKIDAIVDTLEGVIVKVYNINEKHLSFRYNVFVDEDGKCYLKEQTNDQNIEGLEIITKGWAYYIEKVNKSEYEDLKDVKIQSFKLANKILKDCMERGIPCTIISTCLTTMGTDFKLPEHLKREVTICSYLNNDINNAVQAVNRFKDGCKEVILIGPSEVGNFVECGKIDRWLSDWNRFNMDIFLFKRKLIKRQGMRMGLKLINTSFNILNMETIEHIDTIKYTNTKITDKDGKIYKFKDLIILFEEKHNVSSIENVDKETIEELFFKFMLDYKYSHKSKKSLIRSLYDHYTKTGVLINKFTNIFKEEVMINKDGKFEIINDPTKDVVNKSIDDTNNTKGARVGDSIGKAIGKAVGKAIGKAISPETISKQDGLGYFQMSGLKGYKAYLEWCKDNGYDTYSESQFFKLK